MVAPNDDARADSGTAYYGVNVVVIVLFDALGKRAAIGDCLLESDAISVHSIYNAGLARL